MSAGRHARAFTLVEAVVAAALAAILAAAALATLTKVSGQAVAAEARANLDRVVVAQQRFAALYGTYTPLPADLGDLGGDLTTTTGVSTGPNLVSIAVGTDASLAVAVGDSRGNCHARRVDALDAGAAAADVTVAGPCVAAAALGGAAPVDARTARR